MSPITKLMLKYVAGLVAVVCVGIVLIIVQALAPFADPILFEIIVSAFVSFVILSPVTLLIAYGVRRIFHRTNKSAAQWAFFIVLFIIKVGFGSANGVVVLGGPLLQAILAYWLLQRIDELRAPTATLGAPPEAFTEKLAKAADAKRPIPPAGS
jgi:hypothetical protein